MIDIELLKYPIGRFQKPQHITDDILKDAITYISAFPAYLKDTIQAFTEEQLNSPYRPGGWTVAQLIHHVSDSHMNAMMRFKLALTEDNPTIKPYDEAAWAKLADYEMSISESIPLIRGIHAKWVIILNSMSSSDFERTYFHPDNQAVVPLSEITVMYQWHSMHHLAHIQHLIIRENW